MIRSVLATVATAGVFATLFACGDETPCDRYADYMCACHPEVSCDDFLQLAEDPSAAVIAQCTLDLADQRAEDDAAGASCTP
jgi:hypothetical protein